MKKGKLAQEKKQLSILLIPHSSSKVKTIKFSALYSRVLAVFVMFLIMLACLATFVFFTIYENRSLKADNIHLRNTYVEQNNLLKEKVHEIAELKENENSANQTIKDFINKYKELTDKYVASRTSSSMTSRSSSRSDSSFLSDMNELKDLLNSLNEMNDPENKVLVDLSTTENKIKKFIESVPSLWPTSGKVTSKFGVRVDPFLFRKRSHEGIDISAPSGQSIKAAGSGTVTLSGWYSGYGNAVIINHGRGISTLYGHSSKLLVKKGQTVKKGDVIAKVGSTGRSTGPHLHFEVRVSNTPVDPLKYLER